MTKLRDGKKLRIAAVSFLNARPITYALERGLGEDRFELSFELPSRCAQLLAAGDVDVGLIPAAAYAESTIPLRVVPGIAIASLGSVRTVLLVSDVPWGELDEIVLDGASRSSAALLKLLCRDRGLTPRFREIPHDQVLGAASGRTGALVIGDAGFVAAKAHPHVIDLGEAWRETTGLPFVYAVWAGRPGVLGADEIGILQQSLSEGLVHRAEIARAWAEAGQKDPGAPALYERYLTENIRYRLGAEELSGVAAFFERGHAAGLFPERARLRFFEQTVSGRAAPPVDVKPARAHSVDTLLADAAAGARLSFEDGLRLYAEAPTLELGAAADLRRRSLHAGNEVTYIIDRNVNYTNVCVTRCKFCNFYRPPTHKTEGYVLSREALAKKFQETVDLGGVQILLQGGLNPNLPLTWYEDLFRWMKANFPLAIHGLSPEEIRYIAEIERMPIRQVIERLMAAGLDSIPGGGAEILDDEIRYAISPLKCTTDVWLEVMRQGHALGLRTTATMVFGFGEQP
ncbi:MAG: hypothetical protein JWM82_241, partial [Myxococcales bacterium]|nr:hypothetical protein [Myxococcales bacterium]